MSVALQERCSYWAPIGSALKMQSTSAVSPTSRRTLGITDDAWCLIGLLAKWSHVWHRT